MEVRILLPQPMTLEEQIEYLKQEIAKMDGDNPKSWDLIAAMSKSLVEKENMLD